MGGLASRLCSVEVLWLVAGGRHADEVTKWVRDAQTRRQHFAKRESATRAVSVVENAMKELEAYYEGDTELLEKALVDPSRPNEQLKQRMTEAIVTAAEGTKPKLVFGVVGGSVAAGEHVWDSTAWPSVLKGRLKPVFDKLGVELEVRNEASPRRHEFPENLCLNPILGRDVDVVLREWRRTNWDQGIAHGLLPTGWTMDEDMVWNRNSSVISKKRARPQSLVRARDLAGFEVFLRTAVSLKSQPSVHIVALDPDGGDNSSAFRLALDKGGILHDPYRRHEILFFSAFGQSFDHHRRSQTRRKNCTNLAVCSIEPKRQDGHHSRPLKFGFNPDDHPGSWTSTFSRLRELFVDGRPGALGHELVANQLAYFYLSLLNEALRDLFAGTAPTIRQSPRRRRNRASLPPPVLCGGLLCPASGGPLPICAYSSLPKAGPLDVGDIIANSTGVTRWRNEHVDDAVSFTCDLADKAALEACASGDDSSACFEYHKGCSHHGAFQTRAFEGYSGSGPLQLDIDFPRDARCAVLIAEPILHAKKPLTMANWFHEVTVIVEGNECKPPACTVIQGRHSGAQSIFVDLTLLDHCDECAKCWRLQPIHIDLHVDPILQMDPNICGLASTGRCIPVGKWRHYDLGCARKPDNANSNTNKAACWRPLMHNVLTGEVTDVRNPQLVKAAVSTVVIF